MLFLRMHVNHNYPKKWKEMIIFVESMHIGLQIKLARIAKGLTQQELAERIFKTRPLVSYIEQRGIVNEKTLSEIKKVLDMPQQNDQLLAESKEQYLHLESTHKFMKQEMEFLAREIELLKSENEALRQLTGTQKELIDRLRS